MGDRLEEGGDAGTFSDFISSLVSKSSFLEGSIFAMAVMVLWWMFYTKIPAVEFRTFYTAANTLLSGKSPYPTPGTGVVRGGHAFVYPITTLAYFIPFTTLPYNVALDLFRVAEIGLILVSVKLLLKNEANFAVGVLILVSSFAITALQVLSVEPILLFFIALSWRYRNSVFIGSISLALAIGVKLFLLPLLLWYLLSKRYRAFSISVFAVIILIAPTGFFVSSLTAYYHILQRLSGYESASGLSLVSLLDILVHSETVAFWLTASLALVFTLLLVYVKKKIDPPDRYLFAAIVLWSLIESPIVWSHYFLISVAVVLLLFQTPLGTMSLYAIGSWVLAQPDQITPSFIPWGVAMVMALAALLMYLDRGRFRESLELARTLRRVAKRPGVSFVFLAVAIVGLAIGVFDSFAIPSFAFVSIMISALIAIGFYVKRYEAAR